MGAMNIDIKFKTEIFGPIVNASINLSYAISCSIHGIVDMVDINLTSVENLPYGRTWYHD